MDQANLVACARALGFAEMGVCSTAGFEAQKKLVEAQPELAERRQLRYFPQADCPWATALLVLLWAYSPDPLPQDDDHLFVDSYYFASNQAYHAACALEDRLKQVGYMAKANVSYPAREAAVRAGMGVIGDNGLLITPQHGTRVVIILMATDAVGVPSADCVERKGCLHCGRCTAACPTGALSAGGMTHPERCLRNFMMEGIVVPEAVRPLMKGKLIGCDACQRTCPLQPDRQESAKDQFLVDDFVTSDDALFKEAIHRLGDQIGRNAARPQRVRAQAALLAGNRKHPKDIPVLREWAASEFDAVRIHAQWALNQIECSIQGLDQSCEKR